MGLFTSLKAEAKNPADDFWYMPVSGMISVSGPRISADSALTVSTIFACVRILANSASMLPLQIKERVTVQGREQTREARNHPLWEVLHDQPNSWQTAMEFRSMMMGHLLLRGNFYAQIIPGPRGFADQLIPLHPDRMKVEQLESMRLRYTYSREDGQKIVFTQDDIMHIRGYSDDGLMGKSVLAMARDSIGTTIAADQYAGRFYSQNMTPRGILKTPNALSPEAAARLSQDWKAATSGLSNAHRIPIMEHGLEWQSIGLTHEDAQFLEQQNRQVEEGSRWFGVPLFLLQHTEKATSWGTGIEQMMLGYVIVSLMPWLVTIEQAITRDLILSPRRFFPKHNVDGLLRGDTKSRFEAYRVAIMTGFMTRNEVRQLEDRNPLPGLDDPLVPLNMATVDESGEINDPRLESGGAPEMPPLDERAQKMATQLVALAVRREVLQVERITKRHNGDNEARQVALKEFYAGHTEFIADKFGLPLEQAIAYSSDQLQHERTPDQKMSALIELTLGESDAATNT